MLFQATLVREIPVAVLASVLQRGWKPSLRDNLHHRFRGEGSISGCGTERSRESIKGAFCGEIRPGVNAVGVGGRAEVVGERELVHHDDVAFAAVVFGHDVYEVVIECLLVWEVTIAAVAVDQLGVCRFHVLFEHRLVGEVLGADTAANLKEPFQPSGCLGKFGQWVLLPGVGGSGTS